MSTTLIGSGNKVSRSNFLKILGIAPLLSFVSKRSDSLATNKVLEFTPEMLSRHNYGLYIINDKAKDVKINPGYAATVSWKLCWTLESITNPKFGRKGEHGGEKYSWNKYGKVNFLTDGWYHSIGNTDEAVCEYLNNNPYGEKFRVMTKDEVTYLINYRNQGFL